MNARSLQGSTRSLKKARKSSISLMIFVGSLLLNARPSLASNIKRITNGKSDLGNVEMDALQQATSKIQNDTFRDSLAMFYAKDRVSENEGPLDSNDITQSTVKSQLRGTIERSVHDESGLGLSRGNGHMSIARRDEDTPPQDHLQRGLHRIFDCDRNASPTDRVGYRQRCPENMTCNVVPLSSVHPRRRKRLARTTLGKCTPVTPAPSTSTSPSAAPSTSFVPSAAPSTSAAPSPLPCFSGENVIDQCMDAGLCCLPAGSCSDIADGVEICAGSCMGDGNDVACSGWDSTAKAGYDSCNGSGVCTSVSRNRFKAQVGDESCIHGRNTCQGASGIIGNGSCRGDDDDNPSDEACSISSGIIGDTSCREGEEICAGSTATIGDRSCWGGNRACSASINTSSIGNGSCLNGDNVCFSNFSSIGDGSCISPGNCQFNSSPIGNDKKTSR